MRVHGTELDGKLTTVVAGAGYDGVARNVFKGMIAALKVRVWA
jgi:hypothetical protein